MSFQAFDAFVLSVKYYLCSQIVSMRQEVNKAKLYTINKLIRDLRRLKSKNGTEEQKEKYNRKAERFMEELLFIKVGICADIIPAKPLFLPPSFILGFA
jgi:uncharacterized protein (DUF1919 family)